MKYIREHGRWQHWAPLGYMNVRDATGQPDVVFDPIRAPMVKKLFELYSTGQYSLQSIADYAKSMGLTARRKEGRTIDRNSVYTFLKNPFYYGVMYEAKNIELKAEEQDLQEQMSRYSQIDKDIKAISESVLEISGNLRKVFDCSKPVIQNQILRLLVSNTVLSNKKARISLAKPFDLFLKNPDCMMWSSSLDIIRTFTDDDIIAIEEVKNMLNKEKNYKI